MRNRLGVFVVLTCAALFMAAAGASAKVTDEVIWNTTAPADFGFGTVDYHADTTVDAQVRQGDYWEKATYRLEGVRYTKTDPEASGPEYFEVIRGSFRGFGVGDRDNPTWGFAIVTWRMDIETDDGAEYRCTGLIFDRTATDEREIHRWSGPIIEP